MSRIFTAADQLIGHTPLLELRHIEQEEGLRARLLVKLEYFNPAGSVKDRIARAMIDDAEARGVLLLSAQQHCVPVFEYSPPQVKQAVVGYGNAEKRQVISMVTSLLSLKAPPKPDDTADALALAICHANSAASPLARLGQ